MPSSCPSPRDSSRVTESDAFLADCRRGLALAQKAIPCKWLYDEIGSGLFERICAVEEYYPSRTEVALLAEAIPALAGMVTPGTALIEFGSGASRKTRLLLDALSNIAAYAPIDISETELQQATAAIADAYPHLELFPLNGDFTQPIALGPALSNRPRLGFFPGSTLGNFTPDEAIGFLADARALLGNGSRLLLGIDLAKDADTLRAAYDDAAGVTAAFNLNLLARMNRELGCRIDVGAFAHRARWNATNSRIEMHLLSLRDQHIDLGGERFPLTVGETIHTENSHKFTPQALSAMFAQSGWSLKRQWLSAAPSYCLLLLQG